MSIIVRKTQTIFEFRCLNRNWLFILWENINVIVIITHNTMCSRKNFQVESVSPSLNLIENILVSISFMHPIARRIKQDTIWWAKVRGIPWFTYKYYTRANLLVIIYIIICHSLYHCFILVYGPYFHSWLILLIFFPVPIIRGWDLWINKTKCFSQGQSRFTHLW